jgi:hypothetical protein
MNRIFADVKTTARITRRHLGRSSLLSPDSRKDPGGYLDRSSRLRKEFARCNENAAPKRPFYRPIHSTLQPPPKDIIQNVNFEVRTKRFVSLFQIRRQHIFDPFHECADSARQVAPMRYHQGDVERLVLKIW